MMKTLFLFLITIIFVACNNAETTETPVANTDTGTAAPQDYFPVMDFLKSEIATVDSTPVGIKRYISSIHVNDSGYIEPATFHQLANEFIPAILNDSSFKKNYKETSFLDRSNNAATFFYSANSSNAELRRVDVITQKTDTYDKVKSIYLEKIYNSGDSIIIKKLYWKPERNFQIIKQVSKNNGDPETELTKVVWDNRE